MRRMRQLVSLVTVLAVLAYASVVSAQGPSMAESSGSRVVAMGGGPAKTPRIGVLPLALPDGLTGTLSGLVRDNEGFYWSHTDGGDGTTSWAVRLVKIKVTPKSAQVTEVISLRDEQGNPVSGAVFDPEDIAVAADGTLWLVDEISPLIVQVSRSGQIIKRIEPPTRYKERVKGRGFEGATFAPDGRTLYIMLQTGLATDADKTQTWLLKYDTAAGTFTEYRYQMERPADYGYGQGVSAWIGANALAAVGNDELLVVERDNLSGGNARVKSVYRVRVPAAGSDAPLEKSLVLDAHSLGYDMEKLEGLAVPNSNTMLLLNDNDGNPSLPTVIWFLQF